MFKKLKKPPTYLGWKCGRRRPLRIVFHFYDILVKVTKNRTQTEQFVLD